MIAEHGALDTETEDYSGPVLDILETNEEDISLTIPAKPKLPKYKIKTGKGRPKTATSYDKALEAAKKLEDKGKIVEVYAPEGDDLLYRTGMPEQLQGELK